MSPVGAAKACCWALGADERWGIGWSVSASAGKELFSNRKVAVMTAAIAIPEVRSGCFLFMLSFRADLVVTLSSIMSEGFGAFSL